mmetsp:Transcript_22021/g.34179  ORF Transcript_22021/g.34179 Transcript_22021/m.34179 type:complete len:97 (+) Transcript_22021:151-441(+)
MVKNRKMRPVDFSICNRREGPSPAYKAASSSFEGGLEPRSGFWFWFYVSEGSLAERQQKSLEQRLLVEGLARQQEKGEDVLVSQGWVFMTCYYSFS